MVRCPVTNGYRTADGKFCTTVALHRGFRRITLGYSQFKLLRLNTTLIIIRLKYELNYYSPT